METAKKHPGNSGCRKGIQAEARENSERVLQR